MNRPKRTAAGHNDAEMDVEVVEGGWRSGDVRKMCADHREGCEVARVGFLCCSGGCRLQEFANIVKKKLVTTYWLLDNVSTSTLQCFWHPWFTFKHMCFAVSQQQPRSLERFRSPTFKQVEVHLASCKVSRSCWPSSCAKACTVYVVKMSFSAKQSDLSLLGFFSLLPGSE